MFRDASRHVTHLHRMDMRLHAQAGERRVPGDFLEVRGCLRGRHEVPFSVDLRRRVLLDDVDEGQLGIHVPCKPHGRTEGRLGEP